MLLGTYLFSYFRWNSIPQFHNISHNDWRNITVWPTYLRIFYWNLIVIYNVWILEKKQMRRDLTVKSSFFVRPSAHAPCIKAISRVHPEYANGRCLVVRWGDGRERGSTFWWSIEKKVHESDMQREILDSVHRQIWGFQRFGSAAIVGTYICSYEYQRICDNYIVFIKFKFHRNLLQHFL